MPKSGEPCVEPGTYVSACPCRSKLTIQPGLYFTSCIACGQSVDWHLHAASTSPEPSSPPPGSRTKD